MFAKVFSGALFGLENYLINVEVDIFIQGLPSLTIVGLANKAVAEARERILSALFNSQLPIPEHRTVINLSPADLPKEGTVFDLAMALGILCASGYLKQEQLNNSLFIGELSLDGRILPVRGALSFALLAKKTGLKNLYLPATNLNELGLIADLNIYPLTKFADLVLHLTGQINLPPVRHQGLVPSSIPIDFDYDLVDILGQTTGKRALEIAAAGFHHLLFSGPPGTGKTLLARTLPSILPPLAESEILETTQIYSVCGLLSVEKPLVLNPPFRSPHHTISRNGLIGGGTRPMPGEISLSHRGVLFLDELSEFPRAVLEAIRQPLEDGTVVISRSIGRAAYPTRFMLLAATNPCPCGNLGNSKKPCYCTPNQILQYKKRLSGPILDRIDLFCFIPYLEADKLYLHNNTAASETSQTVRERVQNCREIQKQRFSNSVTKTNGEMNVKEIKKFCRLTAEAETLLKKAIDKYNLSVRSYFKLIKISQTICDLAAEKDIQASHLAEAIQYRWG